MDDPTGITSSLQDLLGQLGSYVFVTATPATHQRFLDQNRRAARDLRDVFGWSLPFVPDLLPAELLQTLERGGLVGPAEGGLVRSTVRVSTLGDLRFVHSAFPTSERDAVFFGPDSYRFVRFLRAQLPQIAGCSHVVDMGAGSGVGGIVAASLLADAKVTLVDTNAVALLFASANAAHAGVAVELVEGNALRDVTGPVDLVIANPPYIMDAAERTYRHGGGMHGAQLSLDWALEAAGRLPSGGTMLLYTGVAIVDARDALGEALTEALPSLGCALSYDEIDPDVFGEELERPAYCDVERIAAVGAVIRKQS
jgi:methylase of polypeptide subunit release factors